MNRHLMTLWLVSLCLLGALATMAGCSNDSGCTPGEERCSCHPDQTCNTGLSCLSDLCVRITDGDADMTDIDNDDDTGGDGDASLDGDTDGDTATEGDADAEMESEPDTDNAVEGDAENDILVDGDAEGDIAKETEVDMEPDMEPDVEDNVESDSEGDSEPVQEAEPEEETQPNEAACLEIVHDECACSHCADAILACQNDHDCINLEACIEVCSNESCVQECASDHPDGAILLSAQSTCYESNCL